MSSSSTAIAPALRASDSEDGPAVRWLSQLLQQAIQWGASDIHLEPSDTDTRVRLRIDGSLQELPALPGDLRDRVVSRIKILSRMDIAERRLPQDGRLELDVDARSMDFRVSTLPTMHGEKLVLRWLQSSQVVRELPSLGLEPDQLEQLLEMVQSPKDSRW